jgi:hypothetical protein
MDGEACVKLDRIAGGDALFRPEVGKQAEAMDGEACVKIVLT